MQSKGYVGIDVFRVIAAMLIVAIHSSPLLSINETADFVFTRIIGRVGVPFFFMATGFFLLPNIIKGQQGGFKKFMIKGVKLYGIATLIYLPVLIYKGYFYEDALLFNIIKDIIFDGTFYHLWYLSAVIMGAGIVTLLLRKYKLGTVFAITFILYVIGVFGDSYYGMIENISIISWFYDLIFSFSDFTRNGIFFAPVYLLLGGMLARQGRQLSKRSSVLGLMISFTLFAVEGMILQYFDIQRHDSMYFMLLPSMFFLFQLLMLWRGKSNRHLRTISMYMYILHPLCIIFVRGIAKIIGLTWLVVHNSLVHYSAVVTASFACSILFVLLFHRKKKSTTAKDRAWIEIDLDRVDHNVKEIKRIIPRTCTFVAVVKANAYGHGDVEIARELNRIGIFTFAVATISEGIRLRKHGVKGDILILGYTHPSEISPLNRYRLIQTVIDSSYAAMLDRLGKRIRVHIKIDTGMHRLGESYDNIANIKSIYQCKNLAIEGIYTHLATSDRLHVADIDFTYQQIERFQQTITKLKRLGYKTGKIHMQGSYGVLNYPELECDYARIGIALYGVYSSAQDDTKVSVDLRSVLSIRARITTVQQITAGETVGYGRHYIAKHATKIATVAIGYADGLPRSLSCGKGDVLVHGHRAPIIGKVCMDQMTIDVTYIADVKQGDIVTIIGQDGADVIRAEDVAVNAETITNELLSRLGNRLQRVYSQRER